MSLVNLLTKEDLFPPNNIILFIEKRLPFKIKVLVPIYSSLVLKSLICWLLTLEEVKLVCLEGLV